MGGRRERIELRKDKRRGREAVYQRILQEKTEKWQTKIFSKVRSEEETNGSRGGLL